MRFRRFIAIAATVSVFAGGIAHAGQYDAEVLGQSLPMWMETLASINDEGDVAWTAWDGTSGDQATTAKFYNAANSTHTLAGTANSSWAVGISEQVTDGGNTVVGIAGSTASSQRLTDRSAVLWDVRWSGANGVDTSIIDLGAVTDGTNGPVQQSAAYGVLARQGNANNYYVGGFARDKVNSQTFPQPVIWTVSDAGTANPSISHHTLPLIDPSATHGSGYVADIAQNGSKIWACGNSTGNNAYNQATCWDVSGGPGSAAIYSALNNDLISSAGFGNNVVTSMIHRVRVVPIGPNGENRTVAVGTALVNESGGGRRWKGFVYDLEGSGASRLYKNLDLTSDNETLAYDVAGLTYQGNNGGTSVTSKGMIIAGISSTASPALHGGLEGGPTGVDVTKMTGVNRRMMLSGITDNGQVCAINDDSQNTHSASYDQLLAISDEGAHRLAMVGNELVLLTAMPDAATVEVRNRDATERKHHYVNRTSVQYHQIQAVLSNPAHAAVVRFGSTLSCDVLSDAGLTGCGTSSPAAFDIVGAKTVSLASTASGSAPSTTVLGAKDNGLFNANSYAYAQIATRNNADCTITPVQTTNASAITVQTNPAQDFDGMTWQECNGVWVDPQTDYEHCSGCGQLAVVTGQGVLNARPLSQCLWGQCVNGAPVPETNVSQRYKTNTCHIENTCFAQDEAKPIDAGAESAVNFCQQCQPSSSQTAWETYPNATCCDANAEPQMSGWHRGYRPTGVNASVATPGWLPRIAEVSDSGFWYRWSGIFNNTVSCSNHDRRVQRLDSYLSPADPENWFVFRHADINASGTGQKSYPRVRVKPRTNSKVKMCLYPRCMDSKTPQQKTNWAAKVLTSNGNNYNSRFTRSYLAEQLVQFVERENSPLDDGNGGLRGVCGYSTEGGGAVDITMIVEEANEALPSSDRCWNFDVFVQITALNDPQPNNCEDTYSLFWGNQSSKGSSVYGPDYLMENKNAYGIWSSLCDDSDHVVQHYP